LNSEEEEKEEEERTTEYSSTNFRATKSVVLFVFGNYVLFSEENFCCFIEIAASE